MYIYAVQLVAKIINSDTSHRRLRHFAANCVVVEFLLKLLYHMMQLQLLCLVGLCVAGSAYRVMERMIPRPSFVKGMKSDAASTHELVFAVVQKNTEVLEEQLMLRSTPGTENYQQWMSYEQVHDLSSNIEGSRAVLEWLSVHDVQVTWQSTHQEYIKATATIATWENVLSASFYEWTDQSQKAELSHKEKTIHRAEHYSLPTSVDKHISGVFNTVQVPPEWKPSYNVLKQDSKRLLSGGRVTPAFLNSYYKIAPFTGTVSPAVQQAVFETNGESFSPGDLTRFQDKFGLPRQAALAPYGHATTDCIHNSCYEGNLDVQYLMGIAPGVATIYWYTGTSDPFLTWITNVANSPNPPMVNSISWGSIEMVGLLLRVFCCLGYCSTTSISAHCRARYDDVYAYVFYLDHSLIVLYSFSLCSGRSDVIDALIQQRSAQTGVTRSHHCGFFWRQWSRGRCELVSERLFQ